MVVVGSVFLTMGDLAPAQQKTLDVVIHDAPWRPGYYAAVKLFEQNFGVKVKTHVMPFSDVYAKLVTIATRGGKEFDVAEFSDDWLPFFFAGRHLWPLKKIDPGFEPDPELITYKHLNRWSFEKNYPTADGVLYTQTFMGNMNLFWYRKDKYEEAGLSTPPETWDEVAVAAEKLYDPDKPFYGYVQRGVRGNPASFGWLPILLSWGGSTFANPPDDWTVTINSRRAKEALEFTLKLLKWAPPGQGDIGQGDMIGLLATDKVLQALSVSAAFSHFDNPKESLVPWKVMPRPVPKSPYGIQDNTTFGVIGWGVPKGSKDKELALEFIKFFTSYEGQMEWTRYGGVPTRTDVYTSELAKQKEYRYLRAMNESFARGPGDFLPKVPECWEIEDVLGKHLNAAYVGLETAEEALDAAAREIEEVMKRRRI
jgi:ABC-type glycerol-3-phosphate transport system substrate-binding protein